MDGSIDDVRIYNRALTSAEVQTLAEQGPVPIATISPTVPAASTFGELITLSGTAGPANQTITDHEWSYVPLMNGVETGTPVVLGTVATMANNSIPIGSNRLRYRVKNSFNVWSVPASKDITIGDPILWSDLSVHRDGIHFLDANGQTVINPKQGDRVTIQAEVKNLSLVDSPASILVTLKDDTTIIGTPTILSLTKGGTATVSIPWHVGYDAGDTAIPAYGDGYKVISVEASYTTADPEVSTNNNLATSFIVVGSPASGNYLIDVSAHASSAIYYTGYTTTINGDAKYSWGSKMPTMGSLVTIVFNGITYTTRTTSPSGNYALTVPLPATIGNYPLTVQVNDNNLVGSASLSLAVVSPPVPSPADLTVQAINFSGPGLYSGANGNTYSQSNSDLNFSAVVQNVGGTAAAAGVKVNFYLNPGGTPFCSGNSGALAPGQNAAVSCTAPFTPFKPTTAGVVNIFAKVDPDNTVSESNEFNNLGNRGIEIKESKPDLRPSAINFSAPPVTGESVTLSAEVTNYGPATLAAGTQIKVEFRDGPTSPVLGTATVYNTSALTPGAKVTASLIWPTTGATIGNHQIYAVVDPNNTVSEDFEDNNQLSRNLTVYANAAVLSPAGIGFSSTAPRVSQAITITGTVRNSGGIGANSDTIRFYLSDPGSTPIGTCTTGAIAGKEGTASCSITTTSQSLPGTSIYYIKTGNGQTYAQGLTTYNLPSADLRIVSEKIYHAPLVPNMGETVSLAADIQNVSGITAEAFTVRFFVDNQGLLTPVGTPVAVTSLAANSTVGVAASSTFPAHEIAYAIKVEVVPSLADANMGDNEATTSFWVHDPNRVDSDGDIVPDDLDNCPNTYNPNQLDSDHDGIGDACDSCPNGSNIDADGDGVPDGCDAILNNATEWKDTDLDGIGDNQDNCPTAANSDQLDGDSDGSGDTCDPGKLTPKFGSIVDAPHNETRGITCGSCHTYSLWWQYAATQDNSPNYGNKSDAVCLGCHGVGVGAISASHSSAGTGHRAALETWSSKCGDCHDPHNQGQLDWIGPENNNNLYLATGTISAPIAIDGGKSTFTYSNLTVNNSNWDPATSNWGRKSSNLPPSGLMLVVDTALAANTLEVLSADSVSKIVTVKGGMDQSWAGKSFGVIYGRLIRSSIQTPYSGPRSVKFFDPQLTYNANLTGGLTDPLNPTAPQGLCQVCHTQTTAWKNDGTLSSHNSSTACTACHKVEKGFSPRP